MTEPANAGGFPTRLLHYELLRPLGEGAWGHTFEGYDPRLQRRVAIRLLAAEHANSGEAIWEFVTQAAAAARVVHPNVARVYFVGQDGPHHFCVREFVDGQSLADRLRSEGSIPEAVALRTLVEVLQGLDAAHALGIAHGNLHAANILFDRTHNRVLLADFHGNVSTEAEPSSHFNPLADLDRVGRLLSQMLGRRPNLTEAGESVPAGESPLFASGQVESFLERLLGTSAACPFSSAREAAQAILESLPLEPHPGETLAWSGTSNETPAPGDGVEFRLQPTIIQVPALEGLPQLPGNLFEAEASGWLAHIRNWISPKDATGASSNSNRLEDTQAAVDGALVDLRRRARWLERLIAEGEAILRELKALPAGAAREAAVIEQRRQVDHLSDRLQEVRAALLRQVAQRDLLQARLQVANVRREAPISAGRSPRRDRWWPAKLLLAIALIVWGIALLPDAFDESTRREIRDYFPSLGGRDRSSNSQRRYDPDAPPVLYWMPEDKLALPRRQLQGTFLNTASDIAFCPDRPIVATAFVDGTVRFWLPETGQELRRFLNWNFDEPKAVHAIAFSRDGRRLAVGGYGFDHTLMIWDVDSATVVRNFPGRLASISSVGFSHDGQVIGAVISGMDISNKDTISLFDVDSGQPIEHFPQRDEDILQMAFSPTTPRFAWCTRKSDTVEVWDYAKRQKTTSLSADGVWLECLAISPRGDFVAAGGPAGALYVWGLPEGFRRFGGQPRFATAITCVSFSPDGSLVATIGGGVARIWNIQKEDVLQYFCTSHSRIAFSPDGRFIVTAGAHDSPPLVWQVDDFLNSSRN